MSNSNLIEEHKELMKQTLEEIRLEKKEAWNKVVLAGQKVYSNLEEELEAADNLILSIFKLQRLIQREKIIPK